MKEIYLRRSIRKYIKKEISKEYIVKLIRAAMAAPSAGNQQPWEFIVVKNKKLFSDIMRIHPSSKMLESAELVIIICSDLYKEKYGSYWIQDCSAATMNLLIEAQYLGIGSVWLGVYPIEGRILGIKHLFDLPINIMPFSIISLGYPAEKKEPIDRYYESKIHINKW